jgi:DNA polymerase III alpha subunit
MYLNCKTYFSFRYGTYSAEELVKEGLHYGVQSMALTNINCTADHWDFYKYCIQHKIQPILGTEIRNNDELLYIILAKNMKGIRIMNAFLSEHLQTKSSFPYKCPLQHDIWIIYPLEKAGYCQEEHEKIGIRPAEVNKLYSLKTLIPKCVVRQAITFKDKKTYNLHRLLRAIDKNIVLSMQKPEEIALPDELFINQGKLFKQFELYPQIITNTLKVSESCHYEFEFKIDKNKKCYSG